MVYSKITWVDYPDVNAQLVNASNLNRMEEGIDAVNRLTASATSPISKKINISAGIIIIDLTILEYNGGEADFGPGGNCEVRAFVNANYYKKVLVCIDKDGNLSIIEGNEAATPLECKNPRYPSDDLPICLVVVQDDGTKQTGSINNISQSDIIDIRPYLQTKGGLSEYERNITEIVYTYDSGLITNIKKRYKNGKYENIDFDYWNSGDSDIDINGHVYDYTTGEGMIRQVVRTIQDKEISPNLTITITSLYGYDSNKQLERMNRSIT